MSENRFNWGAALKQGTSTALSEGRDGSERAPLKPVDPGRYSAIIQSATPEVYTKGSTGITTTFVIVDGEFKNRKLKHRLVMNKADGSLVKGADGRLAEYLMAAGLELEKIHAFKFPKSEHEIGDFRLVIDSPVTIVVKEETDKNGNAVLYQGRPTRKVTGMYIRKEEAKAA